MSWNLIYRHTIALICCIIFMTGTSWAQNKTDIHQVKAGETLFSIARQYNISVQQLKEWNQLDSNELNVGQKLVTGTPAASSGQTTTHTVQAQETLFSISKQYAVTIAELKSWNNLSGNSLSIGQKLVIHTDNSKSAANSGSQSIVVNNKTQDNTYYTVKSGDTLYKIAHGHNMTLSELKQLNDLGSNTISIGQQLTVRATSAPPSVGGSSVESSPQGKFVSYQPERTQNLDNILRKFNMTEDEFHALNPEFTSNRVVPSQKVAVLLPPSRSYQNPYRTNANLKNLGETAVTEYSNSEQGKTTTSGELYNPGTLTAAHSNISLGTIMFIENMKNHKGVYVRINDRISSDGLKLSKASWSALDFSDANPSVKMYQDQ